MSASEKRLYFHLQIAAHQLKKKADEELSRTAGLTTAQSAILSVILKDQPVAQGSVAEQLKQNDSAMTAMVARLLKLGFISKARSPDDGRVWMLAVTEEGKAAHQRSKGSFTEINATLDRILTESESEILSRALDKISAAF
ncbi:MAG: MarR family winged helix-turn-helix transcriptional regulator [Sneathiella sp.]